MVLQAAIITSYQAHSIEIVIKLLSHTKRSSYDRLGVGVGETTKKKAFQTELNQKSRALECKGFDMVNAHVHTDWEVEDFAPNERVKEKAAVQGWDKSSCWHCRKYLYIC